MFSTAYAATHDLFEAYVAIDDSSFATNQPYVTTFDHIVGI